MEKYYKDKELLLKIKEAKKEVESSEEAFIKAQNKELNLINKLNYKDVDDSIVGRYFTKKTGTYLVVHYIRSCANFMLCATTYSFNSYTHLKDVSLSRISVEDLFCGDYRECTEKEISKVLTA